MSVFVRIMQRVKYGQKRNTTFIVYVILLFVPSVWRNENKNLKFWRNELECKLNEYFRGK